MSKITTHVGSRIKMYRKVQGMTLQELADRIHKSRATVSKYENGEIVVDIETLYEISQELHIGLNQLTDYRAKPVIPAEAVTTDMSLKSPFYQAKRLYFYFYDGRYNRLKDGIIDITPKPDSTDDFEATLSISIVTPNGRSSKSYYSGNVVYSDVLIRFSFVNQLNALEEDLLYIFNPLELRDYTEGLLCGISSADFKPCAFKCIVTLSPQELGEDFKKQLMFTQRDLNRWKKLNMMMIDNRGD